MSCTPPFFCPPDSISDIGYAGCYCVNPDKLCFSQVCDEVGNCGFPTTGWTKYDQRLDGVLGDDASKEFALGHYMHLPDEVFQFIRSHAPRKGGSFIVYGIE